MSKLVRNMCYSSNEAAFADLAAHCPSATSSGLGMYCTPTTTGYDVVTVASGGNTSISVSPSLPDCIPEVADVATLSALVLGAWVAVWAVRVIVRAF